MTLGCQPAKLHPHAWIKRTRWTCQITVKLSARETKYRGWENEDQHLFMQPLPQELSCNDQGRSSDWPTLLDQFWAPFVSIRIPLFLLHPPSLRNISTDFDYLVLIERINVLKRLVVAETDRDQRQCGGESALTTGACSHSCPMTKWNTLWDAPQDRLISLAICVVLMKDTHVVLLTSKFQCEIRSKDLKIPPQDVMLSNSSSRSDSRGFSVKKFIMGPVI